MTDDSRVPMPLKGPLKAPLQTPVEAVLSAATPFPTRMVDAEVQEFLNNAAKVGRWMAAVWDHDGGKITLNSKTREFPNDRLAQAAWMFLSDVQLRMLGDDTSPVGQKEWGSWWPLVETELAHLDSLHIGKGGFSSIHVHEKKSNIFTTMFGRITLDIYEGTPADMNLLESHSLEHGNKPVVIPPGTPHRFMAEDEHCLAFELSLPDPGPLNRADIERWSQSGRTV